jgi:hypothetical protein
VEGRRQARRSERQRGFLGGFAPMIEEPGEKRQGPAAFDGQKRIKDLSSDRGAFVAQARLETQNQCASLSAHLTEGASRFDTNSVKALTYARRASSRSMSVQATRASRQVPRRFSAVSEMPPHTGSICL